MNGYLDANILVSLFVGDDLTGRAERCVAGMDRVFVSSWTLAEFSSAAGILLRSGRIDARRAERARDGLDSLLRTLDPPASVENGDIVAADRLLRRPDLRLRTPDALHLAVVQRLRLPLLTFDKVMADAAIALGLTLAPA